MVEASAPRILVAVDFSEGSRRALEHAIALAHQRGAQLEVLHVWTPPWRHASYGLLLEAVAIGADPDALVLEQAERELRAWLGRSDGRGVAVQIAVTVGDPAREIAQAARTSGAELIVIGSRGRGALSHLLMGSVAAEVMRRAPCDVCAVHPHQPERASASA